MVSVLAWSAVCRMFDSRSVQIEDYTIAVCRVSAKYTALRRNENDWLAQNQCVRVGRHVNLRTVVSVC